MSAQVRSLAAEVESALLRGWRLREGRSEGMRGVVEGDRCGVIQVRKPSSSDKLHRTAL